YQRALTGQPTLSVLRDPATLLPDMTMPGAVNTALGISAKPIVEYADNVTDTSPGTVVPIAGGETVVVRAADRRRPAFLGPVTINANVAAGQSATLVLDGFLFGAGIVVSGTGVLALVVRNCTVRPDANTGDGIAWSGASGKLSVERSLFAPIALPSTEV